MIVCIIGLRDDLLPEGKEPVPINLQFSYLQSQI